MLHLKYPEPHPDGLDHWLRLLEACQGDAPSFNVRGAYEDRAVELRLADVDRVALGRYVLEHTSFKAWYLDCLASLNGNDLKELTPDFIAFVIRWEERGHKDFMLAAINTQPVKAVYRQIVIGLERHFERIKRVQNVFHRTSLGVESWAVCRLGAARTYQHELAALFEREWNAQAADEFCDGVVD